ncbi:Diaminopimelate epimerase-like protein [Rhizodiscina lignyota]|uniref:Diaminopimelate epimerase-like protein n=1 Tax=Rhizodiscina lignyota TaxID=1504668 RepID=A0A9P4M609_9PEZI|nr:Diaminopimelate epimerase-like protein [Rhizodiscina lignyota]
MTSSKLRLKYTVFDVFTNTPWAQGNPLAVIQLTKETAKQISQEQKHLIAREFNFSETTFLHDYSDGDTEGHATKRTVDIFTKTKQIPFAGHPTIGTAAYCFNHVFHHDSEGGILIAKAGEIHIRRDRGTGLIGADIPCSNYRVHSQGLGRVERASIVQQHPELQGISESLAHDFPVISIAGGLYFIPVEIELLETMASLRPARPPPDATKVLDEGFSGALGGTMFYHELSSTDDAHRFRVRRMTSIGEEDLATGSAACAFSVWQSQVRSRERPEAGLEKKTIRYEIEQGVEMGRRSEIIVDVTLNDDLRPKKVILSGHAAEVMKGELII